VCELVKDQGATEEATNLLIAPAGVAIRQAVAHMIVEAEKTRTIWYPLRVEHDSLTSAIAAGHYDSFDTELASIFKEVQGFALDTELALYEPEGVISSEQVLEKLDSLGLRSASFIETLAFGEVYPLLQYSFSIVTLPAECRTDLGRAVIALMSFYVGQMACSYSVIKGDWKRKMCVLDFHSNLWNTLLRPTRILAARASQEWSDKSQVRRVGNI
jgi:hypothetical protein